MWTGLFMLLWIWPDFVQKTKRVRCKVIQCVFGFNLSKMIVHLKLKRMNSKWFCILLSSTIRQLIFLYFLVLQFAQLLILHSVFHSTGSTIVAQFREFNRAGNIYRHHMRCDFKIGDRAFDKYWITVKSIMIVWKIVIHIPLIINWSTTPNTQKGNIESDKCVQKKIHCKQAKIKEKKKQSITKQRQKKSRNWNWNQVQLHFVLIIVCISEKPQQTWDYRGIGLYSC